MPNRIRPLILTLCVLAAVVLCAPRLAAAQLVEGRDYRVLKPQRPTSSPGKIEVLEFFSYGCPHCNDFYPLVTAWLAKQPKDVVFKRVAVGFGRPAWVNLARTYYALEADGDLQKLDGPLFHALHEEHRPLFDEPSIAAWVVSQGGDGEKFANAYASFGVNNQTVQSDQLVEDYGVDGIPTIAVDGKYVMLSPAEAADEHAVFTTVLANTDLMIARVRAEDRAAAGHASGAPKGRK